MESLDHAEACPCALCAQRLEGRAFFYEVGLLEAVNVSRLAEDLQYNFDSWLSKSQLRSKRECVTVAGRQVNVYVETEGYWAVVVQFIVVTPHNVSWSKPWEKAFSHRKRGVWFFPLYTQACQSLWTNVYTLTKSITGRIQGHDVGSTLDYITGVGAQSGAMVFGEERSVLKSLREAVHV
ncbi:hypothetical protein RAB80_017360 [Fusarium oxysporum f. sp. vasinfectum]|nr:hypothetical protein RAB80_017360 [Fusarium oxysporum f. sp. vasinfectum]